MRRQRGQPPRIETRPRSRARPPSERKTCSPSMAPLKLKQSEAWVVQQSSPPSCSCQVPLASYGPAAPWLALNRVPSGRKIIRLVPPVLLQLSSWPIRVWRISAEVRVYPGA